MEMVKYDAACRAVAEAKSIDELKEITNRAEAARAYARQAKNKQLELDALEIRVRAERRLGEIIIALKKDGLIRIGGPGRGHENERPPVTLKELDVNSSISAGAQRLAMLPESRFVAEVKSWRHNAEAAQRVEIPLQSYRRPSLRGERQRVAARLGLARIDAGDPFRRFTAPDGRRVADWRAGELQRIADLARRSLECARLLQQEMPVANPDPLATMEMLFEVATLERLLAQVWEAPVDVGNAGIVEAQRQAARERDRRICQECGAEFKAQRPGSAARRGEARANLFCSRSCAGRSIMRARRQKHESGNKTGDAS